LRSHFRQDIRSKIFQKCIIIITRRNIGIWLNDSRLSLPAVSIVTTALKIICKLGEAFEYWVWVVIISESRAHPAMELENSLEIPKSFNWSLNIHSAVWCGVMRKRGSTIYNYYCTSMGLRLLQYIVLRHCSEMSRVTRPVNITTHWSKKLLFSQSQT